MYVFRCTCVHMDVEARDRVVVYLLFFPSTEPLLVWDPPTREGRLASGSQGSACLYFSVP